ncbi:MAG: hypothetical protein HFE84_03465 [Lachnospiraceae bacterium]|nr:hypothetical protein [Lachnospiraceae bacterium]
MDIFWSSYQKSNDRLAVSKNFLPAAIFLEKGLEGGINADCAQSIRFLRVAASKANAKSTSLYSPFVVYYYL